MRMLGAVVGAVVFCAALTLFFQSASDARPADERPVVLILSEPALGWKSAVEDPALSKVFKGGAVAALSTAQGETPPDPRVGYVLIGAGARADTSVLPRKLPNRRAKIPTAFRGPVSTIRPGSFGEALRRAKVQRAAVGGRAALVVMDREGRVPAVYPADHPAAGLQSALKSGAKLVAVEVRSASGASEVANAALECGATVAVASPNAGAGSSAALTPFALYAAPGVLYSPGTRTGGLITNEDLAPTLLKLLKVPEPTGMSGRAALVRPGTLAQVERLQERITFVKRYREEVLRTVLILPAAILALALALRRPGLLGLALLTFTTLPLGLLLSAALPTTDPPASALLGALLAGGFALACRRLCRRPWGAAAGLGAVALLSALAIGLDAAAGGRLMRYSVLGYEPAYGTRFYGLGNEYSAVLAGAAPLALALVVHRRPKLLPPGIFACLLALLAVGLPVSGADVGGCLALGLGLGATLGLIRERSGSERAKVPFRALKVVLWAGGGLILGAAIIAAGGLLLPDASHGARAVSGHSGPLYEVIQRKLLLSFRSLLYPVWDVLLVAQVLAVLAAWRTEAKSPAAGGGPLFAGMLGGAAAALASGAFNDAGVVASVIALVFPTAAALTALTGTPTGNPDRRAAQKRVG